MTSMRRELFLVSVSTVVGVILGFLINKFNPSTWFHWVILIALILLTLSIITLTGPLRLIFSRVAAHESVAGKWVTEWRYAKENGEVIVESEMTLRQIGRFLWGEGSSVKISGPHTEKTIRYKVRGEITPDRVVAGTWKNTDRQQYYGHFLGVLPRAGREVDAKFLGTAEKSPHDGPWKWQRQG